MTNSTHLKLGLLGVSAAGVAVAVALQLLVGGADVSNDDFGGGQPSLGVPAPGFAGLVDEMVVADPSPKATSEELERAEHDIQPLFIEGEPVTPYTAHEVKNLEVTPQIEPTQASDQPLEVQIATEDS